MNQRTELVVIAAVNRLDCKQRARRWALREIGPNYVKVGRITSIPSVYPNTIVKSYRVEVIVKD